MPTNPAQKERSALLTAINAQANIIRRQASALDAHENILGQTVTQIKILTARNSTLEEQMAFVADAAGIAQPLAQIGVVGQRKVASILHKANPGNPAQPVAEPAPEPGIANNQSTMLADGRDDVTQLGATPVTDVSSDATVAVDQPYGEVANQPVGMNRVDVTAPVEGTQGQRPPEETIVPVDVRIGNPDNPQPAFPWEMGPVGDRIPLSTGPSVTSSRTMASLHLARLQIKAGIATGDDLHIANQIDNSQRPAGDIQSEINTLQQVVNAQVKTSSAPKRNLVPRLASNTERFLPSMSEPMVKQASVGDSFRIKDDEIGFF
jgi:hypothetical protein